MANYTINNLPNTVSSISDSDFLPVWDLANEQTAKVTRKNLLGVSKNEVIVSSSTTLTGATLETNSIIRVMFTSAITGSDTTTALPLSYNGTSYPVMVGKQGSLSNFVASYVDSAYTYLQAYTTLELAFDGTQFIIIGNPAVLSSDDYTIYADGKIKFTDDWKLTGDINNSNFSSSTIPIKSYYTDLLLMFQNDGETLAVGLFPAKLIGNSSVFNRIFISHNGASSLYLVVDITSRDSDSITVTCSTNYTATCYARFYFR